MPSLILKVTEQCNSNCCYCEVVRGGDIAQNISLQTLEEIFFRANEYLETHPSEKIQIIWHGGEPLLLGPQYFRSAIKILERCCPKTKSRIEHSIQTNLTCFSEEFLEIFKKLRINSVGTSYDPEPHVRGPGKEIDSERYNKMFMRGIRLLERNNIGWGIIYVVTKKSLAKPLDVFFFLTNLNLTGIININPVIIDNNKEISISPEEYVEFLGGIFPYWWRNRSRFPNVQPFSSLVDAMIDKKTSPGCMEFGTCDANLSHLTIEPNGDVFQTGHFGNNELCGLNYGNIYNTSLHDIIMNKKRALIKQKVRELYKMQCNNCRLTKFCHVTDTSGIENEEYFILKSKWCNARIGFINKYFIPLTGLAIPNLSLQDYNK